MKRKRLSSNSGVTLIEVTLSVAIFAAVIAMSAQALAGFYATSETQEQRVEALQAARAVLSEIRLRRVDFETADDGYNWAGMLAWIADREALGWPNYVRDAQGANPLRAHSLSVRVTDINGEQADPGDDPLQVQVSSAWQDMRGRPISLSLNTVISER